MSRCRALLQIEDKIVDARIVTEYFSCDLSVCRGACCVEGDSGAPLESEEVVGLEAALPELTPGLDARNVEALRGGVAYRDADGDWVTQLVAGRECAFSYCSNGSALCAVERAWRAGRIQQPKPASCALYPIRVARVGVMQRLSYHVWDVCAAARAKGRAEKVKVYEFLRKPLERHFGAEFYAQLDAAAAYMDSNPSGGCNGEQDEGLSQQGSRSAPRFE